MTNQSDVDYWRNRGLYRDHPLIQELEKECTSLRRQVAALEARNKELESALERIASDFETDFVIDGQVVDEPYKTHEWAWRAARAALMTDEEIVKQKWPKAAYTRVLFSPDEKRVGMIVIESEGRAGDEIGIGMTPEEAWSVAARRIQEPGA